MRLLVLLLAFVIRPVEFLYSLWHVSFSPRHRREEPTLELSMQNFRFRITCETCGKIFIDEFTVGPKANA